MIGATRCAKCHKVRPCECVATRQHHRTTSERGYGADWQRCRLAVLSESPMCVDCKQAGRATPATEVHHIRKIKDAPELRLVRDNLMPLCEVCHDARTAMGE